MVIVYSNLCNTLNRYPYIYHSSTLIAPNSNFLIKLYDLLFLRLVLPYINPFDFDGDANAGDSVQLTCYVAKGDLPMTITWLFNEKRIFAHLGIVIIKVGDRSKLLSIPSINGENSGNYKCIATNLAGVFTHNSTLNVHGKI